MKKITIILLFFTAAAISCRYTKGSGHIITQNRNTGTFNGIDAGNAFEIELKQANTTSVEVESDDNLIDLIKTEVHNNILEIKLKSGTTINEGHFKIYISSPTINTIKCSGAAKLQAVGVLKNEEEINVDASGAAKIEIDVDAPHIKTESSGASTIQISGKTKEHEADASGAAKIIAKSLLSENVEVESSGAANVTVYASKSIQAKASGAGKISYAGGANKVQEQASGAGKIIRSE